MHFVDFHECLAGGPHSRRIQGLRGEDVCGWVPDISTDKFHVHALRPYMGFP
jgi:hypothetical protein